MKNLINYTPAACQFYQSYHNGHVTHRVGNRLYPDQPLIGVDSKGYVEITEGEITMIRKQEDGVVIASITSYHETREVTRPIQIDGAFFREVVETSVMVG